MEALYGMKQQLANDISRIEQVLGDMEHGYLTAEYSQCGTVLKGFEGWLSSKDNLRKRTRTFKTEDRLFSLSSKTSPVTKELEQPAVEEQQAPQPAGFGKKGYAQKGYAQKGYPPQKDKR